MGLTDLEIKKVLEGMIQFADTVNRSVLDMVDVQTLKNTLAYINRLQAENEGLFLENQKLLSVMLWGSKKDKKGLLKQIKAEAYKEFAERLKMRFAGTISCNSGAINNATNKILKELVGNNG